MKSIILGVLLIGLSLRIEAGDFAGNGGDGVVVNDKVYALDLYEAGLHLNPSFQDQDPERVKMAYPQVRNALYNFSTETQDAVIQKLLELSKLNKLLAHILAQGIPLFEWYTVDSSLLNIQDEDTPIDFPASMLVQLAIRKGDSILVDRNNLLSLDSKNQAALIFHERIYAFMPFESRALRNGFYHYNIQSSFKARTLVAYIMSPSLQKKGPITLIQKFEPILGYLISSHSKILENGEFYVSGEAKIRLMFKENEEELWNDYMTDYSEASLAEFQSDACSAKYYNRVFYPIYEMRPAYAVVLTRPRNDSERLQLHAGNVGTYSYSQAVQKRLAITDHKKARAFVCDGTSKEFQDRLNKMLAREGFEPNF